MLFPDEDTFNFEWTTRVLSVTLTKVSKKNSKFDFILNKFPNIPVTGSVLTNPTRLAP